MDGRVPIELAQCWGIGTLLRIRFVIRNHQLVFVCASIYTTTTNLSVDTQKHDISLFVDNIKSDTRGLNVR